MEPKYLEKVDLECREFAQIDGGDSGFPQDYDSRHPMPQFCEATDDIAKFFQSDAGEELQKRDVVRSEMKPTRNAPQESKPEETETTCEEFFDCKVEKRASSSDKLRVTRRLIPETNEVMFEYWDYQGSCIFTKFVDTSEVPEGEQPLAKSEIMSQMFKTLNQVRNQMMAEDVELAEKAIRSLDIPCFLEIVRRVAA
jgi:hypothetical protein